MVPKLRKRSGGKSASGDARRFVHERRWIIDTGPAASGLVPHRGKPVGVLDRIRRLADAEVAFVEATADIESIVLESRCDDGRHEHVRLRIACKERR